MPSPFPGMDPYIEHPEVFPGFHDNFLTYLQEALQPRLPDPYYAYGGQRAWVEVSHRYIEPDVNVIRPNRGPKSGPGQDQGGVAVAAIPRNQPVVVRVPHDERREPFLEIFVGKGEHRLVTHIELLSWSNKTPGDHGRDLYLRKQQEILDSQAHLIEIDLLRGGKHTTAVPLDLALAKTGPFDYHICLHRFDNLEDFFVYPIRLEDRLPDLAIPLLPGDGSIAVDIQAIFDRCYEIGPYRRLIEYGADVVKPALSKEREEWLKQRLREKGLLEEKPA